MFDLAETNETGAYRLSIAYKSTTLLPQMLMGERASRKLCSVT